jgi:lysophospholipase-3
MNSDIVSSIPFIVGLTMVGVLLGHNLITKKIDKEKTEEKTESFMALPNGGVSGFGFQQSQSSYPLFLNFYPQQLGTDFNLRSVIQKLRYSQQFPTAVNGLQRGSFTNSGHGQTNFGAAKCPVILIPGIGASKIFGRWNRPFTKDVKKLDAYGNFETSQRWRCREYQDNWVPLWFPDNTTGLSQYCWQDNTKVEYLDGTVVNTEGVETIVPQFGSVDFEGSNPKAGYGYMSVLISALEAMGYAQGSTLFAAPYDFRKICTTNELNNYSESMTRLIERSVALNGKRVFLVAHGLGSSLTNYLLVNSSKEWKDLHIEAFVSFSGCFGGCPKALRVLLSGEELPSREEQRVIRDTTKNFTGLQWMLPSPAIYGSLPMLYYQQVCYKAKDIPTVMSMAGFGDSAQVYNDVVAPVQAKSLEAPEVTTYLLAGVNLPTESSYLYEDSLINNPVKNYPFYKTNQSYEQDFDYPEVFNGDGTIPKFVLEFPISWSNYQKEPVHFRFYERAEHNKIMSMHEPVTDVLNIIKECNGNSILNQGCKHK